MSRVAAEVVPVSIVEDVFFRHVIEKIGELDKKLRSSYSDLYLFVKEEIKRYIRAYPELKKVRKRVVAVDGGIKCLRVSDGSWIYLYRAVAVSGFNICSVHVGIERLLKEPTSVRSLLLVLAESKAAEEAVKKVNPDYILLDGSLYSKVLTVLNSLFEGDAEVLKVCVDALTALHQFLESVKSSGATAVFVSKESNTRRFIDYVLARKMFKEVSKYVDKGLTKVLKYCIMRYPARNLARVRKKLLEIKKSLPEDAKVYVDAYLNHSATDLQVLKSVTDAPWRTRGALLMGIVSPRIVSQIEKHAVSGEEPWKISRVFYREGVSEDVLDTVDKILRSLPAVATAYVRFNTFDYPLQLEFPEWGRKLLEFRCRKFAGVLTREVKQIFEVLASGYVSRNVYNVHLYIADYYARFRGSQLTYYLSVLRNVLSRYGLDLGRRWM